MSQTASKPHFRIIAGRPVSVGPTEEKIAIARNRFGRPFAHEPGGDGWKPRATRFLTEWLAGRVKERA